LRQSEMEIRELETIFWAYRDRMIDLENDRRIRYVHIYRNQGCQAGSTIDHPYSVLMALPIIPQTLQEELDGARRHFDYKSRCVYCDIIRQEIQHKGRIIIETRHFVAFQAFAPRQPFETWILPKRHSAMFPEVEPGEIRDLAKIFKDVFSRLDAALNFPDYNYVIHTSPFGLNCSEFYHWHLEILPRVCRLGGCELGSGVYINSTPPEEAAQYLRDL
ncbi:MAG: DUF4921 family protein, partial [Deltaproteobacteria bacterium]|nr:DUF4921 family protein [Deltaproteobacteria bacterium]